MSTTKYDLVITITKTTGFKQEDVKRVVQMVLDGVIDALEDEGRLELRGFGVFEVREMEARRALNPSTGEAVIVPARRRVKFKTGKLMQERIDRPRRQPPWNERSE
jgi:nucleoid DNA-binding protein